MMKRVLIITTLLSLFLLSGCNNLKEPVNNKTEFYLNEEAKIDHYNIILNDIVETKSFENNNPENDNYLILEFKITNNSDKTQILNSENNFKLIIDNNTYKDLYHNTETEIQPNESIMYQVIYDVPEKDSYDLYFYSGVVSNNIKFVTQ